ncbi:hypothetical protein [Hellea balneolensis]|uniref:hypothetical protein n=1 Tax=Hellea balneolensis TaxID=287478 RepID=UPI000405B667|nr:hypothetical protein [Hellea balneolensis]
MKASLIAMWRLFHALAFYPIMIGVFIWLYIDGADWIWGAFIIAGILIFDPIWRIMGRNILNMIQKK